MGLASARSKPMKTTTAIIIILSLFLMSGVSNRKAPARVENVDIVSETDKEVVERSVAMEQAEIISDMKGQVQELHYMTCQITRMLKSTGDNDVRRECEHRDSNSQPTSRSGVTHRGGNGYHLTTSSERQPAP